MISVPALGLSPPPLLLLIWLTSPSSDGRILLGYLLLDVLLEYNTVESRSITTDTIHGV